MTECQIIAEAIKRLASSKEFGSARCNDCLTAFLSALSKVIDDKVKA